MKLILLILLTLSSTAYAQSSAQLQAELGKKQPRLWGATLINTTSVSALDPGDPRGTLNHTMTAMFRYKLPWFNFRVMGSGNKDLNGSRQDRFTSAFIEASTAVGFLSNDSVTTIFQGRLHPAVNDERREQESHQGAVSAGLLYIVSLPNPKFQIIGITRVTKNIHEFEINRSFGENTSVSAMGYAALSYFPAAKWEVSGNVTFLQGYDYRGESKENLTYLGQSVSYNHSRNLIMTFGHELGGRTYGYDQNNLDVALFDEDKSSFYASFTLNY
ncbi:MAG: hypothetical protein VXV96_18270 [Bdellovibrionota bacterium]|nr:hypothetical protein [Bdellovibrionota bacterium]